MAETTTTTRKPDGSYVEANWTDADGNPTTQAMATLVEVIEYDAAGNQLRRTYAEVRSGEPAGGLLESIEPESYPPGEYLPGSDPGRFTWEDDDIVVVKRPPSDAPGQ